MTITISNEETYENYILRTKNSDGDEEIFFSYPCASYSDCFPFEITLKKGFYYLECWGASGSDHSRQGLFAKGGTGGYASGIYFAKQPQNLYLYIGGSENLTGQNFLSKGSFNGQKDGGNNIFDGIGGGATDFRTKNGSWSDNPQTRVIVAGAGGSGRVTGPIKNNLYPYDGGRGGGPNGEQGTGYYCNSSYGSQTSSVIVPCDTKVDVVNGGFGYGGSGSWSSGGGGWFGGGLIGSGSGGGGSGYVGKLFGIGKYSLRNEFSDHVGFGKAKITILPSQQLVKYFLNTFQRRYVPFHMSLYLLFILLDK